MENLFYSPIIKEGSEFVQVRRLDEDELIMYHINNYKNIVDEHFISEEGIVMLDTGKFQTIIFRPKNESDDIYLCLVTKDNLPCNAREASINADNIETLMEELSLKVKTSEGIFNDQIIDISANFVTPRLKFNDSSNEFFYHQKYFKNNFIIFGAPGSGKTTMLRKLTLDYIVDAFDNSNNLKKLPIYIQLRDFNNYNNEFDDFIDNCINNSFSTNFFTSSIDFRKNGNLCLLLDGADEIDFEKFNVFKSTITNFKNNNPLISFVITSRPDKNYENLDGFKKCFVLPFNKNQVRELTYRKLSKGNLWKNFISILNTTPEIYDILKNPLLLTISHFLYSHKSIPPLNTGQLIKELVATLVSNWDSQRNIERKLSNKKVSPIEINNFLGKLALLHSELKKEYIGSDEIIHSFKNFESIEDLNVYLEYVNFSTGIIKINNDGKWHFSHKSIQDYFCSIFLVESLAELKKDLFVDKSWDKILLMISGLSSDPNYIIRHILGTKHLLEFEKIKNCLSIYNESHLLSKNDIEESFTILERFFVDFEKNNNVSDSNLKVNNKNILIQIAKSTKGFTEVLSLMTVLFKIRFTKYELDFFGYLTTSKSHILSSVSRIIPKKGNIDIQINEEDTLIKQEEESPEFDD